MIIYKRIFFAIAIITFSCNERVNDAIKFSPEDLRVIRIHMERINDFYSSLIENGLKKESLGYFFDKENNLISKHCFNKVQKKYLPQSECNYLGLVKDSELVDFEMSARILKKFGLNNVGYEPSIYSLVFYQHYERYNYNALRIYSLRKQISDSVVNVSYLKVYDEQEGVLFLGTKPL